MHDPEMHQGWPRLWLFAGTGEGPPLVQGLLAMGWRVRLSLLSAAAERAYPPHPRLEVRIGAVGGAQALGNALDQARAAGDPFALVVDATHPFAQTISADLAAACSLHHQPLWRLHRPQTLTAATAGFTLLPRLEGLAGVQLKNENLLLAIGHRQLTEAIALTPGARHHARLLPNAPGLRVAMAAGLAPERVACLKPTPPGRPWSQSVEAALLRRWKISVILARESGSATEACWRSLASQLQLPLILIQRPCPPCGGMDLEREALLKQAEAWLTKTWLTKTWLSQNRAQPQALPGQTSIQPAIQPQP